MQRSVLKDALEYSPITNADLSVVNRNKNEQTTKGQTKQTDK